MLLLHIRFDFLCKTTHNTQIMHELTSQQNVEQFLAQRGNLELLEDNLARFGQDYQTVKFRKGQDKLGDSLRYRNLWQILPEVEKEVETFLAIPKLGSSRFILFELPSILRKSIVTGLVVGGLSYLNNADKPSAEALPSSLALGILAGAILTLYAYKECSNSSYERGGTITLGEKKTVPATIVLAHELAHKACAERDILGGRGNPISEGFARGVERGIAEIFAIRYDNPTYMSDPIERIAMELKDAYLLVCEAQKLTPRKSLESLDVPRRREGVLKLNFLYDFMVRHYSSGVAAVCIGESQRGKEVYREIIKGDLSFLDGRFSDRVPRL